MRLDLLDHHSRLDSPVHRAPAAAKLGVAVALVLATVLCPLTMAFFNPARDLGPRVFSALAGWGAVPFRVNGVGWLTVYVLAPLLGGLLGGAVYTAFFKRAYASQPG
jgi:glycerol uptake facilitator protein